MVTNVTSLLKTVKAVEDEATRGTRALEATIECIKQELTVRGPENLVFMVFFESRLMRHSLSAELAQTGSGISVSIILNKKQGSFLSFFSPLLSVQLLSFLPASQPLQVSHSSYQTVCSRCRQSEKGRRFQELVFLFFFVICS